LIEEELRDTRIRSPYDGVISERQVDRGAYVSAGDILATVYQADPVEVTFSVAERHMGPVRRGQRVDVLVAAYPDEAFQGEVHFISPTVDEATRTFRVRARVPNPEGRLKPGAFATAMVTVNIREDRPVVPEEALVGTRHGYIDFVINGGHAVVRELQTGLRRDGVVEVLDGVSVGDAVVRAGHLRLTDGDRVALAGQANGESPGPPGAVQALTLADDHDVRPEGGEG
jgi:membrane fusion protein, multidrug efflux system